MSDKKERSAIDVVNEWTPQLLWATPVVVGLVFGVATLLTLIGDAIRQSIGYDRVSNGHDVLYCFLTGLVVPAVPASIYLIALTIAWLIDRKRARDREALRGFEEDWT